MILNNGWRTLGAFLLGAAGVVAFAPLGWFVVNWLTLGGLFVLLCVEADGTVSPSGSALVLSRRGALVAFAFAFGLFLTGVSWVYVSLSVFGGMPMLLACLSTVLFCVVLALFAALAGALFVRLAAPGIFARVLLFSALWTLAEWSRSSAFTGFPWLVAGYSQSPPSPLAGYAPLFGIYGASLSSALVGALVGTSIGALIGEVAKHRLANVTRGRLWLPLLASAVILGAGGLLREVRWTQITGEPLSVALLQGNVAQDMKWRPERFVDSLRTYYQLMSAHPARLTVLPETALPAFIDQVPADYLDALRELARRENGDVLFGIAAAERGQYFNAALSLGTSGQQRYSKVHLVPFGEFVPWGFAWFMALASIPMSDFTAGSPGSLPLRLAGQSVAVNICYEDAFGEEIVGSLPAATLLVNISNVAWFGESLAPAQHLQIAQMRALETGRMMLRATNTGMTAIVAVDGRVQSVLPPFTRGALIGKVHGYSGATPYVRWGNWPPVVIALLLVALVIGRSRLRTPAGQAQTSQLAPSTVRPSSHDQTCFKTPIKSIRLRP